MDPISCELNEGQRGDLALEGTSVDEGPRQGEGWGVDRLLIH